MKLIFYTANLSSELKIAFAEQGIRAGFPSPAQDYMTDSIDLNRELVRHPATTFYARAVGDSMRDCGIDDGDLLVIDKSLDPQNVIRYKKAGVIVWNICPDTAIQTSLFDKVDRERQARLSAAVDAINRKNGHNTVKIAVQGTDEGGWHLKCEHISRQYTTNLDEVIRVK